MVDRNQTPSSTSIVLSDSEFAKRAAPGGRLPVGTAKSNAYGDKAYSRSTMRRPQRSLPAPRESTHASALTLSAVATPEGSDR
jgi:hypothetical protein